MKTLSELVRDTTFTRRKLMYAIRKGELKPHYHHKYKRYKITQESWEKFLKNKTIKEQYGTQSK